jgi:myo-inositol-1(or 4)-monophosphatase
LEVCEQAVRVAGATVQDWIGRTSVRHKGHADLVTEADFASQETIRRIVLGAFPNHALLGEEEVPGAAPPQPGQYRWIADPLDGTTNYVHGLPHYCVSLALEHDGAVLAGAVFDPCRDECFTASAGGGAMLNGRPLQTSTVEQLGDALVATGFPTRVTPDCPEFLLFCEALWKCQAIRRLGSAALNICYVAAGRLDLVWGFSAKIWDVAAGLLILQEAGGMVTSPDGGPLRLEQPRFIAAGNASLHAQLQQMVRHTLQL